MNAFVIMNGAYLDVKNIKGAIKKLLGERYSYLLVNFYLLIVNFFCDAVLFVRHSTVFNKETLSKIEAQLILDYHSIEKGLLFKNTKPRFAQYRIENLHPRLALDIVKNNVSRSQIRVAYQVMCEYYRLHEKISVDISDYFTLLQYENYKSILGEHYGEEFKAAIEYGRENFYLNNENSFPIFSQSRKSVRDFTGELVSHSIIEQAVKVAMNAPSACNRQASKVYLLEDKSKIDKLLSVQGGLTGYTQNINQILILTVDRSYFYTVGERNQFYIDGGIFLMNLLYGLHYFKVANCPAHWGKTIQEERMLSGFLNIPESEKIICVIPIGVAVDSFRVTLSQRRDLSEVLINI